MASQSCTVEPTGHINVGGVPAVRVPLTVKLTDASSSSVTDPLFGMESESVTDELEIYASFVMVAPFVALTVTAIVIVADAPGASVPTVHTPVPEL